MDQDSGKPVTMATDLNCLLTAFSLSMISAQASLLQKHAGGAGSGAGLGLSSGIEK